MSYYPRGRGGAGPRGPRGMSGPRPSGYGPPPLPPDMIYKSFDPLESKHLFQRVVAQEKDDSELSQAILTKIQELTPPPEELAKLQEQVTKFTSIIDTIVMSPEQAIDIEEMRVVGSFKKGTMIAGHKTADFVLIIKHLPTLEDVNNIMNTIKEKLNALQPDKGKKTIVKTHESGFTYNYNGTILNVFITTLPNNTKETIDPEKHVKLENLKNSMAAIRHARWFEENAYQSSIRVLVRILKDFKRRIPFFKNMNPWTTDLLAHHAAVANTNGNQLTVPQVFRRCLQLLAAGILLPGSASICDPCEPGFVKAHSFMSYEHQDELACGAQTLLRALSHGGYKEVLAMKGARKVTFDQAVMFDGIIVTPSKLAYEKPPEAQEPMETNGS